MGWEGPFVLLSQVTIVPAPDGRWNGNWQMEHEALPEEPSQMQFFPP